LGEGYASPADIGIPGSKSPLVLCDPCHLCRASDPFGSHTVLANAVAETWT